VRALAGQAAVSIENSQLYEAIERLFEGFVKAAVTAIEQRHPTTSGHSERVATRTVAMATLVDRVDDGPYRHVNFTPEQIREIRYAGLLHDFGKVGVREQVLIKAKKLYAENLILVRQRYAFIRRSAQWRFEKERADYLLANGTKGYETFLLELQSRHEADIALTDRFLRVVLESNEPTVLAEGNFEQLSEFSARTFEDIDGNSMPFLTEPEVRMLSIRKGSLDEEERLEIESHVTHTFDFLRRIPWTKGLSQIPDIAHAHHEKPMVRLPGDRAAEIPVQSDDDRTSSTPSPRGPSLQRVPAATRALDIMQDR
jgi:hypothetical protein